MDELLHLLHSDGADELRIRVGQPPTIILERKLQPLESAVISLEDAERYLQAIASSRQRLDLRERGKVEFLYRFRERVTFVVRAWIENDNLAMDIH